MISRCDQAVKINMKAEGESLLQLQIFENSSDHGLQGKRLPQKIEICDRRNGMKC